MGDYRAREHRNGDGECTDFGTAGMRRRWSGGFWGSWAPEWWWGRREHDFRVGVLEVWPGRRTRRTCVELVVELVVFNEVLVELVENKDLIHKSS